MATRTLSNEPFKARVAPYKLTTVGAAMIRLVAEGYICSG